MSTDIKVTQTVLYGSPDGAKAFDDLTGVAGWPVSQRLDRIKEIKVRHGDIVDNITITYEQQGGLGPTTQSHGGDTGAGVEDICLAGTERLVGIYGVAGSVSDAYGSTSIYKLSFVIADHKNGSVKVKGPFGIATQSGTTFSITANVLAFAGRTSNRNYLQALSVYTQD
ncbi:hypothetical protein QCA50_006707 [Cerrena zonata]|uniref:Jacalin-type lectin domain-containing protein n=1 Tax=Cerrena zonata TaxID=2478898 RepID=A0AAW0GES0_9APHY